MSWTFEAEFPNGKIDEICISLIEGVQYSVQPIKLYELGHEEPIIVPGKAQFKPIKMRFGPGKIDWLFLQCLQQFTGYAKLTYYNDLGEKATQWELQGLQLKASMCIGDYVDTAEWVFSKATVQVDDLDTTFNEPTYEVCIIDEERYV